MLCSIAKGSWYCLCGKVRVAARRGAAGSRRLEVDGSRYRMVVGYGRKGNLAILVTCEIYGPRVAPFLR